MTKTVSIKRNPVESSKNKVKYHTPARTLVASFFSVILIGTILLCLPISSKTGAFTPLINSLFTATTSTCVTGLVVYDTFSHWSYFGQAVIILLIQIGGIGIVTLTTFFTSMFKHKIGLGSMIIARESVNTNSLNNLASLLKLVVVSTLSIETLGAIMLSFRFIPQFGREGIWISVFTAVSAYCNAGIDIFGRLGKFTSITTYADDPLVNITIASLIIIGGLGFIVFQDLLNYRKKKKLMLHTKIVLLVTGFLLLLGAVLFFTMEYSNPDTIGNFPMGKKILASYFQSVTPRTAGYNSVDLSSLRDPTKILMCALMFIGAAPGSTGGGIKVTTFTVLIMTVVATLRNKTETTILKRRVDYKVVYKSLSIAFLSALVVSITTSVLLIENNTMTIDSIFEAFSAFATVGLSTGITPTLGVASKLALIITMFIGRIGSFSFFIAMTLKQNHESRKLIIPEGEIVVG